MADKTRRDCQLRKKNIHSIYFQWSHNEFLCHQKLCIYIVKDVIKISQVLIDILLINCFDEDHLPESWGNVRSSESPFLLTYLIYLQFISMRQLSCEFSTPPPFPGAYEKILGNTITLLPHTSIF